MKLASLKKGRDGQLIVVNKDLTHYILATDIAPTMQYAFDRWASVGPKLALLYKELNEGALENSKPFNAKDCASPLPRSYQTVDGSAYLHHVELVRKARGAELPPEFLHDPLMYQAVSDTTWGPCDPVPVGSEDWGIDYEAEVAVIVDDVPMGCSPEDALDHIKLVMLMNDVSLRMLIPSELSKGFGFLQGKPPSAYSPVAVSPEELGDHWKGGKLHLPLVSHINDEEFGHPNAGADMQFDFGTLIAHAAKSRPLGAGTIVGSGTVSNRDPDSGYSCVAEVRMLEKINNGDSTTSFLKFGDTIKIEMFDDKGSSIFGAIDQEVIEYCGAETVCNKQKMAC